jgi:ABC-type multidrug transport system ATPase subunit
MKRGLRFKRAYDLNKVFFIDEPTFGLDLNSSIQNIGLCKIDKPADCNHSLTTYYIDEVDQLIDRIRI